MIRLLSVFLFLLCNQALLFGQIDTEFWFAVPEVTEAHADRPVYLRISTLDAAATVSITQPANSAFTPITISIPANSTRSIDMTSRLALIENTVPNQVQAKGLLISSTTLITAYYEILGTSQWGIVNCDIFSLKGRNALGKRFYTPFQNYWNNYPGIEAYSSIDIVATENNTEVTILPSRDLMGHPAGVPFTVVLNKGETYSVWAAGIGADDHLSGTLITSDKPVAVTIKDDSLLESSNWDLAGDQIIPVELAGSEYVVIRASGIFDVDRVFICATENDTEVFLNGSALPDTTLQAGETFMYPLNNDIEFIKTGKPAYAFHISGFTTELAGALLPPVGCTGSRQVGFTRPTSEEFALNIVVRAGGEAYFRLNGSASLVKASAFTAVPGTGGAWKAAHIIFSEAQVRTGSPGMLKNDSADFHLGLLNGGPDTGFRYGYFSDYGVVDLGEDRSICQGDSLVFNGGFGMSSYLWNTNSASQHLQNATTQYVTVKDSGTYWVKINKGTACVLRDSIDSVHVAFYPSPRKVLGKDTTVCSNSGFVITMDTLYSAYTWQDGSANSVYAPAHTGTYTVEAKNHFGCSTKDTIYVTVNKAPRPVISFDPDLERTCLEPSVTLDAGAGYKSYRWHNGETSQTIVTPHLPEYYVVVTDFNNCTDSTNLYPDCSPYVKVFNLITPNDDQMNDVFYVEGLQPGKWILEVYSRWGDRVYYNRSYGNEFDGRSLPSGVYFYHLRHVEDKKDFKGWLNIIKPD